jgi:quercetin dioxygenase-like cupin family protein
MTWWLRSLFNAAGRSLRSMSGSTGQTLIVTAGSGWVQAWGGPVQEINPGDVIRTPPSE